MTTDFLQAEYKYWGVTRVVIDLSSQNRSVLPIVYSQGFRPKGFFKTQGHLSRLGGGGRQNHPRTKCATPGREGGLRNPNRLKPSTSWFRSQVFTTRIRKDKGTRPKITERKESLSKAPTSPSFSHFFAAYRSRQKTELKLQARELHKAAPLSPRRPPLQRLPHHRICPPTQLQPGPGPREAAAPPEAELGKQ